MIRDVHASSKRNRKKAMRARAWLNGEEVTRRCFYADSRRGLVRLLKHRDGKPYVDPLKDETAKEEVRGRVVIGRAA